MRRDVDRTAYLWLYKPTGPGASTFRSLSNVRLCATLSRRFSEYASWSVANHSALDQSTIWKASAILETHPIGTLRPLTSEAFGCTDGTTGPLMVKRCLDMVGGLQRANTDVLHCTPKKISHESNWNKKMWKSLAQPRSPANTTAGGFSGCCSCMLPPRINAELRSCPGPVH